MAFNCFRFLGYTNFGQVDRLTIPEYNLLMEAVEYKQVDESYKLHQLAYLTFAAQAKKRKGKYREAPVYSNFKKFYDYEKELNKIKQRRKNNCFTGISNLIKKQQKGG